MISPGGRPFARWLVPPAVSATEAHRGDQSGARFDHSRLDSLPRAHVDPAGLVDYASLDRKKAVLDDYVGSLATAPFADFGRDAKLALLINAYNAFKLRLVLDHRPVASIKEGAGRL